MKYRILRFQSLPSTNSLMMQYAAQGAPEGLVVSADHQTRGRGKPGRQWLSPKGENLLASVLLRPPMKAHQIPLLTQTVCRTVATVLKKSYDIDSLFKRPNDVMVGGRKICGVLIEASSRASGDVDSVIVGIGLNVNAVPKKVKNLAVCIADITGKKHPVGQVLINVLDQLTLDLENVYDTVA